MKKIVIGTVLALSVIAFSGCSYKNACAPKLPTCATPAPCGCHK